VTALRPVDANRSPGLLRRLFSAAVTTRPALFVSRNVSWHLDPLLLRLTRGRVATTMMVPTAVLETVGARTGAVRHNAVVYWHDGPRVVIAASQAGAPTNPAWYYNLVARPNVKIGGIPMHATQVDDAQECQRLWQLGDRVFPAFAVYRRRAAAAGRNIPVIVLTPKRSSSPSDDGG
jgi:deazaflavin-dependent oxidoreductase (nitroreductase family)